MIYEHFKRLCNEIIKKKHITELHINLEILEPVMLSPWTCYIDPFCVAGVFMEETIKVWGAQEKQLLYVYT